MTTLRDEPVLDATLQQPRRLAPPPAIVGDVLDLAEAAARGVSFRGALHDMIGEPRQDAFAFGGNDGWLVAVVADGIGSCVNSHHGAAAAVNAIVEAVTGGEVDPHDGPALLSVADAAAANAADELEVNHRTVSATVTVAVVDRCPRADGSLQVVLHAVGDSPAVLLEPAAAVWTYLHDGGGGPSNVVKSWVPGRISHAFSAGVLLPPRAVLVLASDGFTTPLGDGTGTLGAALAARWASPRGLFPFMVDLSFNAYHDDKTVVALWNLAMGEGGADEPDVGDSND